MTRLLPRRCVTTHNPNRVAQLFPFDDLANGSGTETGIHDRQLHARGLMGDDGDYHGTGDGRYHDSWRKCERERMFWVA